MEQFVFVDKNKLDSLPKAIGVYAFTAKKSRRSGALACAGRETGLLYIGKAINIQNRVKNHFNQPSYRDNLFIEKVEKIGYLETNSEIEALILEANLIKKHQPKYNVMWRDDKNYFYVAFENNTQNVPYVYITHQIQNSKSKNKTSYIGPFIEGVALKKTLRFLRKAFPYYTAKKHGQNKCIYCHLDLCPGPNPNIISYKKNIKKLVLILKGKKNAVLNSLKKEMKVLSKEKKFEEAVKIRDRIRHLQQIMAHTHVIGGQKLETNNQNWEKTEKALQSILGLNKKIKKIECFDVSNIQGKEATGSMSVFVDGKPDKNLYRKFKIKMKNEPNDIAMLKETISRRLGHPEWKYPEIILVDGGKAQLNVALKIKNSKNQKIKIIAIAKGRQKLFIEKRAGAIPLNSLPQEVYNLVKYLDDEAHRFAISYHKNLRRKKLLQ